MKCEQIQDLLSSYIDGMTGEKENEIIRRHVDNCSKCQLELRAYESVVQMLRELPAPLAPEKFMADFKDRLAQEHSNILDFHAGDISTVRKSGWTSWFAATAAAVALAAGIYMSSFLPTGQQVATIEPEKPSALSADQIIEKMGLTPDKGTQVAQPFKPFVQNDPVDENTSEDNHITPSEVQAPATNDSVIQTAQNPDTPPPNPANPVDVSTDNSSNAVANYIAHHYYSSTTVADVSGSVSQVENIAKEHGLAYNVVSGDQSSALVTATANNTPEQSVILQVPPDELPAVLSSLSHSGISQPVVTDIDYNSQYQDITTQLQDNQASINSLQANPQPTQEQQQQLHNLQATQQILQNQQQLIQSESGKVNVEISFNTAVKP